jgi:hypothetical protein
LAMLIDLSLHRQQEIRDPLHLVECHGNRQGGDEPVRVRPSAGAHRRPIESDVAVLANEPDQRALARLPWPGDEHCRRVEQRSFDPGSNPSRVHTHTPAGISQLLRDIFTSMPGVLVMPGRRK